MDILALHRLVGQPPRPLWTHYAVYQCRDCGARRLIPLPALRHPIVRAALATGMARIECLSCHGHDMEQAGMALS